MYRVFSPRALLGIPYWYALGMATGAATAGSLIAGSALGALIAAVALLFGLGFLWWPLRVLVISPHGLRLRAARKKGWGSSPVLTGIDWRDVHEVFVAPRGGAATLVVGRWVWPGGQVTLDAVRTELPRGYDHGRLMDAISRTAPNVPVHDVNPADLLVRTRQPYTVRPPYERTRLVAFALGGAMMAAAFMADHYDVNLGITFVLPPVLLAIQWTPLLEIKPDSLRLSRWDLRVTRWPAVSSIEVRDLDGRVEIEVATSSGRKVTRRLPRARIDLEALEAALRAYAPPRALRLS
jgi:hypothetical protein